MTLTFCACGAGLRLLRDRHTLGTGRNLSKYQIEMMARLAPRCFHTGKEHVCTDRRHAVLLPAHVTKLDEPS